MRTPSPHEMTCGFLIQLVFYIKFANVTLLRKNLDPLLSGVSECFHIYLHIHRRSGLQ